MSNLQRQKKLRGAVRAATTRLLDKIDQEVGKEDPSTDLLDEYLEHLMARERALLDSDHDIEAETAEDDLEDEVNSTFEYMDRIMSRKNRIKRILGNVDDNQSAASGASQYSNNEMRRQAVKLPKLVMEKFSGDVSKWQSFWSQFETAVDNNASLTKSDKFTYLKSFLYGTAANVVKGLSLSDENYDNAKKMLISRFGRKDLIINAHMNKLLNLAPVKKAWDVAALRRLYDDIDKCAV